MAAPSSTIWGNTVNSKGRLGLKFNFAEKSDEPDKVDITVDIWFWSRYPLEDANNTLYFNNLATYAKKVEKRDVKIKHTQSGKNGWNTRNQTKIRTVDTFTAKRETVARTYSCAARLAGIDGIDSIPVSANYIIEALPKYNIIYDLNGGEGNFSSGSQFYGMNYILPSTVPSKSGLIFQGWKIDGTDEVYPAGSEILIKQETKLVAQWGETSIIYLTYDANGGIGSLPAESSDDGSFVIKPGEGFSKEGYSFIGWKDDLGETYTPGETKEFTSSMVLYAQWEEVSVNLKFYIRKGETRIDDDNYLIRDDMGEPVSITKKTNENVLIDILTKYPISLEPYEFKNEWLCVYEDGEGTEERYREKQLFTKKVNKDIRFYAQWCDPKSKITLRKDDEIDAAELQEIDGSEIILSKDGILYASEFIEKDNGIYFTKNTNKISSVRFNELKF